nr:HipA family kinase [Thiolinea disciformis]
MGGTLASSLGLNIPAFAIGYVNDALFKILPEEVQRALGRSELFLSESIPYAKDLRWDHVAMIPEQERQLVTLFDLWVRNEDRTLRPNTRAGNPNLLFANGKLYIIDHNLIFDEHFDIEKFRDTYVFAEAIDVLQSDMVKRESWLKLLELALQSWDLAWRRTPSDWKETELFNATGIRHQLDEDVTAGTFWKRLAS